MPFDIDELVRLGAAWLPAGLVPPEALARMASIPPGLPRAFAVGGFECRLGAADAARVDFSACIRRADGGAPLAAWLAERNRGEALRRWRPALQFLARWMHADSLLGREVPAVWLEFDVDPLESGSPVPFLIFTLVPPWQRAESWTVAADAAAVAEGLGALSLDAPDPDVMARVDDCIRSLPGGGCVLHAAIRPQATGDAVRLILQLPWKAVPAYLQSIGAEHATAGLAALLARLCRTTARHSVHIDIGGGIAPRVGIEFCFPTPPARDPRWQALFDDLTALGACTPRSRSLVSAWPAAAGAGEAAPIVGDLLLKVDHEPGAVRAKAYLPFYPA